MTLRFRSTGWSEIIALVVATSFTSLVFELQYLPIPSELSGQQLPPEDGIEAHFRHLGPEPGQNRTDIPRNVICVRSLDRFCFARSLSFLAHAPATGLGAVLVFVDQHFAPLYDNTVFQEHHQ